MRLIAALLASTFAAATGWAQLLPAGEFAGRTGRPGPGKTWKVTEARGQLLAAELNAVAARTPIVIDYDHQTLFAATSGTKAPAAGWINAVEWRKGEGLFAKVDWTPAAKAHIDAGEYRYISPVILYDQDTGDVTHVAMGSLVNHPDLLGMDAATTAALAALVPSTHSPENDAMNPTLAALLAALALPAATSEADALSAVTALKARADAPPKAALSAALASALGLQAGADETAALSAVTALKAPDQAALTAMAALQGQVAALSAQINGEKLTATVDQALKDGKLLPAQKDWALGLGKTDLAALSAYLASAPVLTGLAGQSDGKGPGNTAAAALSADTEKLRAGFGLTAEQWAKGAPVAA